MKIALRINLILTVLLSLATGIFKVFQNEADIKLFEEIGFNNTDTTILGAFQCLGGLLLIPAQSRKAGAVVMALTFTIASFAVFYNGLLIFGWCSLIFIVMAMICYATLSLHSKTSDIALQ